MHAPTPLCTAIDPRTHEGLIVDGDRHDVETTRPDERYLPPHRRCPCLIPAAMAGALSCDWSPAPTEDTK